MVTVDERESREWEEVPVGEMEEFTSNPFHVYWIFFLITGLVLRKKQLLPVLPSLLHDFPHPSSTQNSAMAWFSHIMGLNRLL